MSINLKMIDFQKAQDEISKALGGLVTKKFVTVGIHETADQPEGADITMATLGAIQNFGTEDGNIPAREWLIPGVRSGDKEYIETIGEGIANQDDPDKTLEQVGLLAVGYTQQYITDLQDPPNAPSTIRQKGSSNPLIDTGQMRQSVTHLVQNNKPEEGLA